MDGLTASPYGGGDGLDFKAVLKEYSMEMDKKRKMPSSSFIARKSPKTGMNTESKVFPNGSASIDVNMQKPSVH